MKNKRKIIKKYLSQFEALDAGIAITYYNNDKRAIECIWYKKDDRYFYGPPDFKSYSLKQMRAHVIRLMDLKVFW